MCLESNDFLITYNPGCVEYCSDSSDFGDSDYDIRKKNMDRIERNMYCSRSDESRYLKDQRNVEYLWKNETAVTKECKCRNCIIQTDKKYCCSYRKKGKCCVETSCNIGGIQPTQSKLAIMRSKILPCLSSIFCRSNTNRLGHTKESPMNVSKDNCCQVYAVSQTENRRSKKGKDFTFQSVSTDDELDLTPVLLKPTKDISEHCSENCDLLSSALSLETAKHKMKTMVEKELKKYYLKKQYIRRNKEQQYPSRNNVKVYSTTNSENQVNNFGCDVMPSNSSVFWEYLVDRINKKYQTRSGTLKSCHCTNSQQCPSTVGQKFQPPTKEYITQDQYANTSLTCLCKNSPLTNNSANTSDSGVNKKTNLASKPNCQCKCPKPVGNNHVATPIPGTPQSLPHSSEPQPPTHENEEAKKPCQEPHDEVKASLQDKYNGEILCIHNPPCILINGCLNLPPVKGQFAPTAWPVTQETSYHIESFIRNNAIVERACQYQPPEMQYSEYDCEMMAEKMTQSICNHNPPCEVVRCCYKPNFDLKLDNSCIHVPMCPKIPECLLNERDNVSKVCDHQPKCPELPICKEQRLEMNHADNVGVQVKPRLKMECRHDPPCIMIPKCLGKMMSEGYVSYEAIPGCTHQPPCEMIPACCRKSAKMVSVYCQYPAPCRIV